MYSRIGSLLFVLLASPSLLAGTAHGTLAVNVVLAGPTSGTCISESLSAETGAIVRVACQTGQFVDISPVPGRPFAGTHGGAFRFIFGSGHWVEASLAGTADILLGMGTVTAMRIYRADEENGPLEMLVSF